MTDPNKSVTNITPKYLVELKEDLLSIRSRSDALRLAGLNDEPGAFAKQKQKIEELWELVTACHCSLQKHDSPDTLGIRPFLASAYWAVCAADNMFHRWQGLGLDSMQTFDDEGHKRLIEKHFANSRRRFVDLMREAREAAHIAYFLINLMKPQPVGAPHAESP